MLDFDVDSMVIFLIYEKVQRNPQWNHLVETVLIGGDKISE